MKSQQELVWDALASPHRRRLLCLLRREELCVGDLKDILGWPQSTTSRHLLYLQKRGFLRSRQDGLWRYYSLREAWGGVERRLWSALKVLSGGDPRHREDGRKMRRLIKKVRGIRRKKYAGRSRGGLGGRS